MSKNLANEFKEAHRKFKIELDLIQKKMNKLTPDTKSIAFKGKLECVIPFKGLGVNTVHRLLLSYGNINYLKSVPMGIFINFNKKSNFKILKVLIKIWRKIKEKIICC